MGNYLKKAFIKKEKTMSIFNSESEMDRFERHMRPLRAFNENRKLKLIRDELKKDLQLQRKMLRLKKAEQRKLEKELQSLKPLQLELPLKRPI